MSPAEQHINQYFFNRLCKTSTRHVPSSNKKTDLKLFCFNIKLKSFPRNLVIFLKQFTKYETSQHCHKATLQVRSANRKC